MNRLQNIKAYVVSRAKVETDLPDGQKLSYKQIEECWKKAQGLSPEEQAERAQIYDEIRPTHYHYD